MNKVRCKNCKEYRDKDTAYSVDLSSFCDYECFSSFNSKRNSAKKPRPVKAKPSKPRPSSPKRTANHKRTPKGSTSRVDSKVDYSRVPSEVREYVLSRDGRCRLCGGYDNLAVHHIAYRSEARWFWWCSTPQNLITLCVNCHVPIAHKDKKRFKPILLGLVWLREVENDARMNVYEFEEWIENEI